MKCMVSDRGLTNHGDPCEQEFVRNAWFPIGVSSDIKIVTQLSKPNPQGRSAPRCRKLQWKVNSPSLTRRVGELPDYVNCSGK